MAVTDQEVSLEKFDEPEILARPGDEARARAVLAKKAASPSQTSSLLKVCNSPAHGS